MKHQLRYRPRRVATALRGALLLAALGAVCSGSQALAQSYPITIVNVSVAPPYSPYLSDWERHPDRVTVTMRNTDPATSYDVRLSGFAENTDGSVRVETKDDYPGAQRITLAPGAVVTVNARATGLFNVNAIRFKGTSSGSIKRAGQLPEGTYRVCVHALDYNKPAVPLSRPDPPTCSNPFTIRYIDEPRPITPTCGGSVRSAVKPQYLTFQWIAPEAPAGTEYEFLMVEIPDGRSAEEAIKTAPEPPFFRRAGIITTSLVYTPAEPLLRPGARYAWRVTARDPQSRVLFRRDGQSQACQFTYDAGGGVLGGGGDSSGKGSKHYDDSLGFGRRDSLGGDQGPLIDDKLLVAGITLVPVTQFGDGSVRPQFSVRIDPDINADAIRGGRLEVWRLESRGEDPNAVASRSERRVFDQSTEGSPLKALRYSAAKDGAGTIDLLFVNRGGSQYTFDPKAGEDYIWRFTLDYDPTSIRTDGKFIARGSASSSFGRFPDVSVRAMLPDTLISGGFVIVVEEWDRTSRSADRALPSGIGRVRLECNRTRDAAPWSRFSGISPRTFDIVPHVTDSAHQMSRDEAYVVDPTLGAGDRLELELPDAARAPWRIVPDRNIYLDYFRRHASDGIRVAFHDVRWSGPVRPSVTLTDGVAIYPSSPAVPPPPAEVQLDSSFSLAIDSLAITPAGATVRGGILLPESIISPTGCTRARLELSDTRITPDCELYREGVRGPYGPFYVGITDVQIRGSGYTVDFSSLASPGGRPLDWRGVTLDSGSTVSTGEPMISNRGYTKAFYDIHDGVITAGGFAGDLRLRYSYAYTSLEPYGYRVEVRSGSITFASSGISSGRFDDAVITPPDSAMRPAGRALFAHTSLTVESDMDLKGQVTLHDDLGWGELTRRRDGAPARTRYLLSAADHDLAGSAYFGARWMAPYYPVADGTFHDIPRRPDGSPRMEENGIQGVAFTTLGHQQLTITTPDMPTEGAVFSIPGQLIDSGWAVIGANGVHADIALIEDRNALHDIMMGPAYLTAQYKGGEPLRTSFGIPATPGDNKRPPTAHLQFVESSVWDMNLTGDIALGGPINGSIRFRRMMFTSSADCAGGQLNLDSGLAMEYWGVRMVAREPGSSAGLVCVKNGLIYTTAAGIAEPRHFERPFFLTWGEVKATGNVGRLYADFNSVGQKFDRFKYSPATFTLSEYTPAVTETVRDSGTGGRFPLRGYLHTSGGLSLGFFGMKHMSISDFRLDGLTVRTRDSAVAGGVMSVPVWEPDGRGGTRRALDTVGDGDPNRLGRWIRVREREHLGTTPSELTWQRDWAGIGTFDFAMKYDSAALDGFFGSGHVGVEPLRGLVGATMTTRAEGSCFQMIASGSVGFNLAHIGNAGAVGNVWGCGCMVGESLERIAFGGDMTTYAGALFNLARAGSSASAIFSITPRRTTMEVDGDFFTNVMDVDVEVTGMSRFIIDYGEGYIAGALRGSVNLSSFVAGISGEGEFDWHLAAPIPGLVRDPYMFIQGRVGVHVYALVVGAGLEAGVFIGVNVPKERAWVMSDAGGRFGVNMAILPDRLTGFYAYLSQEANFNVLVVSGGYRVYVGVGAFDGTVLGVTPTVLPGAARPGGGSITASVLGNLGVLVYGKVLGGLVSLSAFANIQMLVGLPPAFEGSIGLEACALWVLCATVDLHCGFNANQGFYLY